MIRYFTAPGLAAFLVVVLGRISLEGFRAALAR
jgi:hypothetical protein